MLMLESQDIRAENNVGPYLVCLVPHFTYEEIESRGAGRDWSTDLDTLR